MTKLELIKNSYIGIAGHISSDTKLESLELYLNTNKLIFDKFKGVIVASNYAFDALKERTHELYRKYFDDVKFIDLDVNRGHTIGTLDLDGAIFDYCKKNDIEWLFKVNDDMLYTPEFLEDEELPDAYFYYWQGVGFSGLEKYDYDLDRMVNEYFYPQTTQYFINTTKIPELHSKQVVTEAYDYVQGLENYNDKIWEYIQGFTCEDLLKNAVMRNGLVKHHIMKDDTYIRLLDFVKANQIHDPSHKQMIIDGTLHLQWPDAKCIII